MVPFVGSYDLNSWFYGYLVHTFLLCPTTALFGVRG
jgi:hypothetical protein